MAFPQQDGPAAARLKRPMAETGSFGRSTRRSRSRTGTPARREDPTVAAADKVFSNWFATLDAESTSPPPSTSQADSGADSPDLGPCLAPATSIPATIRQNTPTEVVLRGYRSATQQYAVVDHFERLAGRICEDYPRDPPAENRRYKSELRDPALTQRLRTPLTLAERQCVNEAHSGEHWVKITFESSEAADAAVYSSPQSILGCLVYATLWQGRAQTLRDEAIFDPAVYNRGGLDGAGADETLGRASSQQRPGAQHNSRPGFANNRSGSGGNRQLSAAAVNTNGSGNSHFSAWWQGRVPGGLSDWGETVSPQPSQSSSQTLDTGTLTAGSGTLSPGTITGRQDDDDTATIRGGNNTAAITTGRKAAPIAANNGEFCHRIPTARRAKIEPADQALLPAPSFAQRLANHMPLLRWFGGALIGDEVPRTDVGEFDWGRASLYWKCMWYLDWLFNVFGGEIRNADKED